MREIGEDEGCYPVEGGERMGVFKKSRKATLAKHMYVGYFVD